MATPTRLAAGARVFVPALVLSRQVWVLCVSRLEVVALHMDHSFLSFIQISHKGMLDPMLFYEELLDRAVAFHMALPALARAVGIL